jgi:signal transduction histidine kinase
VPITFSVAAEVCCEVITDEEWLWQMLLNLLTNACKYTDKGGIHVAISVSSEVTLPASGGDSTIGDSKNNSPRPVALLFEVIDTGR